MTARDIRGDVIITSSYKDIIAERIDGKLEIRTGSGSVTVKYAKKDVNIVSTYKAIQVSHVQGSLTVDGGSCSVVAEDVKGDVKISNSYKYVVVKGTSGSIVVMGESSPIEVSQIKSIPANGEIELRTTYKPVTIHIPKDANVSISAQTEYGKIRSDFPVYLSDDDNKDIKIEMGKSTIPVTIKTSKDINIRRD